MSNTRKNQEPEKKGWPQILIDYEQTIARDPDYYNRQEQARKQDGEKAIMQYARNALANISSTEIASITKAAFASQAEQPSILEQAMLFRPGSYGNMVVPGQAKAVTQSGLLAALPNAANKMPTPINNSRPAALNEQLHNPANSLRITQLSSAAPMESGQALSEAFGANRSDVEAGQRQAQQQPIKRPSLEEVTTGNPVYNLSLFGGPFRSEDRATVRYLLDRCKQGNTDPRLEYGTFLPDFLINHAESGIPSILEQDMVSTSDLQGGPGLQPNQDESFRIIQKWIKNHEEDFFIIENEEDLSATEKAEIQQLRDEVRAFFAIGKNENQQK